MKKFLSILLMSLMIMSVMAGCGEKTPSETPGETPQETPGGTPSEGIGTKDNPIEVTIIVKDVSPSDESIQAAVKEIEEGMAEEGNYVKLTYLEPPTGTYGEAVPLAFRTGQISPDIIYFQGGDLPVSNDGMLEDLTKYVDNSKYVKDIMEEH